MTPYWSKDGVTIKKNEMANENYHPAKRRRSNSSSSSSFSSSGEESFIEDSDDSVRDPNFTVNKVIEESSEYDEKAYTLTILTTVPLNELSQDLINNAGIENCVSSTIDQFIATSEDSIVADLICDQEENANTPQNEAREDVVARNTVNKTNEITPTKKGKKKQRREEEWKKNIAKELKNTGKSYTTKVVPERQMKEPCKDNCSFKCQISFTVEQRKQLHEDYWNLGSIKKQWTFVANSTEVIVPKVRYVKIDSEGNQIQSKREHVNAYYFMSSGNKLECVSYFLKIHWPSTTVP